MKRILVGMLAAVTLLAFAISSEPGTGDVHASIPGSTNAPLLSCADVDGSGAEVDLFNDIFGVALKFGTDAADAGPGEPDGYHVLYDVGDGNGEIDLFKDIFGVAFDFGTTCPLVDQQVAKATLWGIANLPTTNDTAGIAALAALGYIRSSSDVQGQGIHYTKRQNWDDNFDPEAPEGVVYNNGKLAAQLYIVDGNDPDITWGTHEATSFPPPSVPHRVDLEIAADGPTCSPACSWDGTYDGWHMHYYLCTYGIGTDDALARPGDVINPGANDAYPIDIHNASECGTLSGEPACTIPIVITPCYRWGQNVGWMGHLWNHQLNPNQIADTGGNNGRFADCTPDGSTWKAFTCPS